MDTRLGIEGLNRTVATKSDHGVKFEIAEVVFDDFLHIKRHDDDSSEYEERWQTIGTARQVLFVVYTEVGEDDIRLISARVADPKERRIYHGIGKTYPYGWERANY
ncbi:hypothetical protein AGMMS49940_02470 [Spirochaetia bacterium]|nr:hypothetical protein AGMMS49940_02470 [Spirochaetia bacterium]